MAAVVGCSVGNVVDIVVANVVDTVVVDGPVDCWTCIVVSCCIRTHRSCCCNLQLLVTLELVTAFLAFLFC